jgi:hypothetical protein
MMLKLPVIDDELKKVSIHHWLLACDRGQATNDGFLKGDI